MLFLTRLTTVVEDMTSDKQYADKDDTVTLTCAFKDPASITATVTWYKNDSPITTGVTKPSAGKSIMTFASSAFTDNGEYKCKVDYGAPYNSVTGASLKQFVRGVETGVTSKEFILFGAAVTFTCIAHGDAFKGDVVWSNTAGPLATGSIYTQDTQGYSASAYTTTSTLAISATTTDDTTSFTCTLTQGTATKTGVIEVEILCKFNMLVVKCTVMLLM